MALRELLEQFGVVYEDRAAVYQLLLEAPIEPRSRVNLWFEYARERGFAVTDAERAALSA